MKTMKGWWLGAAVWLVGAANAQATVIWRGDFRTRDLSQWSSWQAASIDRLAVVPASNPAGAALRVTLRKGDVAWNSSRTSSLGNRAEVARSAKLTEGMDRWYNYRVLFGTDYAVTDGKNGGAVFTQFHHWSSSGEPGSPPLMLVARTNDIQVHQLPYLGAPAANVIATIPHVKGRWRDLQLHGTFSTDPTKGLVELWADGTRVLNKRCATLFKGYSNYLKMGLYRRPTAVETNVVYFEGMVEATSRSDR